MAKVLATPRDITERQRARLAQIVAATERLIPCDGEHSELVTLREAAVLLETSRPNATALCDAGGLGPVQTGEDGRRRVQRGTVEHYAAAIAAANQGAMTPREAGIAADIYCRIEN